MEGKDTLEKGDKAQEQKWEKAQHAQRAKSQLVGLEHLENWSPRGSEGMERYQRHGLKSTQEGFRFAWKKFFSRVCDEGWVENLRTEQTAF